MQFCMLRYPSRLAILFFFKASNPAKYMVKEAVMTYGNAAGAIVSAVHAADVDGER